MYADGLKHALREKNVWGWGQMGWLGMGTGVMGINLWGWGGYGENKLSPCSSLHWTHLSPGLFNPLMGTLKPQSNSTLCSNTVISTLAVDGWADIFFGTARRGLGGAAAIYVR